MKSLFEKMEVTVDPVSFNMIVRGIVNWCNATLMNISQTRKRLLAMELAEGEVPTIDTQAGDPEEAEEQARERAHDLGFAFSGPELLRRGEYFASIRAHCMEIAEAKGWTDFDKPRNFQDYIEARIKGLKTAQITETDIKREMRDTIGSTAAEARAWLVSSNKKQAAKMEDDLKYLCAEDGRYSSSMDPDEALDLLGAVMEYRARTKMISTLCYEADRINVVRQDYPNFEELRTKRHMLLVDSIKMQYEQAIFKVENKIQIDKELRENERLVLTDITDGHRMRLKLVKEAMDEETRLRKEILQEQMDKERDRHAA